MNVDKMIVKRSTDDKLMIVKFNSIEEFDEFDKKYPMNIDLFNQEFPNTFVLKWNDDSDNNYYNAYPFNRYIEEIRTELVFLEKCKYELRIRL